MEFIHPYWLFGLLAIAIPIIIHLFNFRRYKKYYFTNLKFLKSIKKETQKQHRLRHFLILMARILTIIAIVMAFARPYFPGPKDLQETASGMVSIYVDNSMSMQASANGHRLLDDALAISAEVARAYKASDRFQLITNDFEGKHQAYYSRDEFLKLLAEVRITPQRRMLIETYDRFNELRPKAASKDVHLYIVSDFQQSSMDISCLEDDSVNMIFLIPVIRESLGNVFIDSAWFDSPVNNIGQRQALNARFVNASEMSLEKIPVRLTINNIQRGMASLDIEADMNASLKIPFTNREAGIQSAMLSIDDYPITWDNDLFLSWEVKPSIPTLAIYNETPGYYLSGLLNNDSVFDYSGKKLKSLDYGTFNSNDFIILDNIKTVSSGLSAELQKFVRSGGSLLMIPNMESDIESINSFLKSMNSGQFAGFDTTSLMVTGLDTEHQLFDDVFESVPENLDLPIVKGHFPLTAYRRGVTDIIMDMQNADPLISMTAAGKGKLYLMCSPAGDEFGNLTRHAIWVPMIYRMAMLSRPAENIYYTMGETNKLKANKGNLGDKDEYLIHLVGSDFEFIPGLHNTGEHTDLLFYDMIKQAGQYEVISNDEVVQGFSFNFNRLESNPEIFRQDDISNSIALMANERIFLLESGKNAVYQSVTEMKGGVELWKIFVWLALFFILIEILLLRSFRK